MACIPYHQKYPESLLKKYHELAVQKMQDVLGYYVCRDKSQIGGSGVFLKTLDQDNLITSEDEPLIKRGQIVGLYPGLLYAPYQPLLIQSIGNRFIFRCLDGIHIDGNHKRLSKIIYSSCLGRDQVGHYPIADRTWMTEYPLNPLNVGQYVNNQSKNFESNVAYQELTISRSSLPLEAMRFIPNMWYSFDSNHSSNNIRLVALVATRNIGRNEELFSDYFTVVS